MTARMLVEPDGSLTVGGIPARCGWFRCFMLDGLLGSWCDVLVERGPAPDVQEVGPGGWYVSLPWQYRGRAVDGLAVMV